MLLQNPSRPAFINGCGPALIEPDDGPAELINGDGRGIHAAEVHRKVLRDLLQSPVKAAFRPDHQRSRRVFFPPALKGFCCPEDPVSLLEKTVKRNKGFIGKGRPCITEHIARSIYLSGPTGTEFQKF